MPDFFRGVGLAAGFKVFKDWEQCLKEKDLLFYYFGSGLERPSTADLKTRVRQIEEFDWHLVKSVLAWAEQNPECRLLITSDTVCSLSKGRRVHGPVPFLMTGSGIAEDGAAVFSEKACAQGKLEITDGYRLVESFVQTRKS